MSAESADQAAAAAAFIARWRDADGTELANYQLFVHDLATLLGVPHPAPAPLDLEQLAAHFSGRGAWKKRLPDIVDSLAALGRVKAETREGRMVLHG